MATVYYLELLTRMVDTMVDQGHPRILLQSISDSPDRTAYITGKSTQSPLPLLVETARSLQNAGADFLTIPCVTAHYFYEQLTQAVDIPIINLVEETAEQVYDSFLKGNDQELGIRSYGACVDLLVAYFGNNA